MTRILNAGSRFDEDEAAAVSTVNCLDGDGREEDEEEDEAKVREGGREPASISGIAREGSVVSVPSAWPILEPASATVSIGAFERLPYPDLTRLFVVSSLCSEEPKWQGGGGGCFSRVDRSTDG